MSEWTGDAQDGPVAAAAIHHGHGVRPEVASLLAISDADRLREEDPFTGQWTAAGAVRYVAQTSRFEVDLNRPRSSCVYLRPEDSWGLHVWRDTPPDDVAESSRRAHDRFYAATARAMDALVAAHGRFVLLDVHSYNHRRSGPGAPPEDPAANPVVNVGTGSMDRARWARVVDAFSEAMSSATLRGERLDVRENVRFRGGYLSTWVHERYPQTGCCLAIEFKKVFMDEWTGEPDAGAVAEIAAAMRRAAGSVATALQSG